MTVFEFKRPADRGLGEESSTIERPRVAGSTLRWGRAVLFEGLWSARAEAFREVAARIQQEMPHGFLDGHQDLIDAFLRAVREMVQFGLECVKRGPEFAAAARLPEAALDSAQLAASRGVPADVLVARHAVGSEAFWAWVAQGVDRVTLSGDPQLTERLRFALLEDVRRMQAALVCRVHREIPAAHPHGSLTAAAASLAPARLTARELEVHELLKAGCTDRQIASRLGIAYYTARGYVRDVLKKLGVNDRRLLIETALLLAVPRLRVSARASSRD